ncbi:MAG TPA: hypothetical protein VL970_01185, partial [Candidatus Acidoferrales bacterium]|nr:hypothetical protein [Candidatus Acidoferrales bacterium]
MNKHSEYNADRLEATRQAANRVKRLAWIMNAGAVVISLLLAGALADYCWSLPPVGRWLSLGTMGLLIAGGVLRLMWLWRHPIDLKQTALEMEARRPELGCLVSTAAEYLSGERQASHEYEPELVAALQEQAARRLVLVELPFYRRLLRSGSIVSLALGATLLFILIAPGSLTALDRVTAPWSKQTYTSVKVKPGNGELPVGRDLNIQAVFAGRPPKNPRLCWRNPSNSSWHTMALDRATNDLYAAVIKKVGGPLEYQVTGNDAVSPVYAVTTYVPPEVKDLAIEVRLPAYVKQPPTVEHEPEISVLRASQLNFRITPSCSLAKAKLRFANQPPIPLRPDATNVW